MVGPPPQSQSQSQSQPAAEEETLKRSTDCVYFLASPLTCKKGSECEYRHSDIARMNPRDCWFWLHGNCLNPKCGFRHPPLDGLLGSQLPISAGSSIPPSPATTAPVAHVPHTSGKQVAPCIFFQKGFCLKGDWCPFLHGPNATSNKAAQVPGTTAAAEPVTFKQGFGELENCTQEKKAPSISITKSVELPLQAKSTVEVETVPPRNKLASSRKTQQTSGINNEFSSYRPSGPPANYGNTVSGSIRVQQPNMFEELGGTDSKDAEEISREPSPGFDVLVEDELGDSDYYPSEDHYRMTRDHKEMNEYDVGHSADYGSFADGDSDRLRTHRGYDSYESVQGHYAWEQRRVSSERMPGGSPYLERRQYAADSLGQVEETDLRHRLSKHRRSNGLKSVISNEFTRDKNVKDLSYEGLRRDELVPRNESSLGNRLRGRIKLPGRSSSPIDGRALLRGREINRGTDLGRVSPGRTHLSSHHGRLQDRIKETVEQDFRSDGKNRGLRNMTGDNNSDFTGPKTLAELKIRKNADSSEQHATYQQSLGKRKHSVLDGHQQTGGDLSFEGPKSLDEILKRKRGEIPGTGSGRMSSSTNEDNNQKNGKESTTKSTGSNDGMSIPLFNNKEEFQSASGNEAGAEEIRSTDASELEAEDVTIVEDDVDQECEGNEQKDHESNYEQFDGEYYELDEGDNGDAEEEYPEEEEEEDGDKEFAKKMGAMY
ncbi:Zinc finger CCCH domain-containing protein 17 [Forsythia ovata]|uniref:Zinc finger CCCH domain-containing protein 17 n=1 Tax=Forsythia ovata TaxID=205694 RepID=A0ABD1W7K7_9LAMI